MYVIVGIIAFLLYFIYDVNEVVWKNKVIHKLFFVASVLIGIATFGVVARRIIQNEIHVMKACLFGIVAMVNLLLLLYTLFFALPFEETYIKEREEREVYDQGLYALCRHPGVLWFIGLYVSLWLGLGGKELLLTAILYSLCNIAYVLFQDRWTFLHTFSNYHIYKQHTPFLIPTNKSIKKCLQYIRGGSCDENDIRG